MSNLFDAPRDEVDTVNELAVIDRSPSALGLLSIESSRTLVNSALMLCPTDTSVDTILLVLDLKIM